MDLSQDYSRVGVYNNETHYLSKYLSGRHLDLSNYLPWFLKWDGASDILRGLGIRKRALKEAFDEGSDELYEMCNRIVAAMSDEEKEEFTGQIAHRYPSDAPSWSHMGVRESRLPRQTWLVHFSDQTGKIVSEGFTRGIEDMDQIAYTRHFTDNAKKYGGYNFAFIAGNRDSLNAAAEGKYGDGAVMFQSSGIEVEHYGDQENQVIYWGRSIDPRTIVELSKDGREWMVAPRRRSPMNQKGRDFVYKGSFVEVVDWVEKHWFQYRRQIMGK